LEAVTAARQAAADSTGIGFSADIESANVFARSAEWWLIEGGFKG
jgi:hypothetical protein